ncbi:M14 family metallopeptidase [Haloferax massiliensis]|uniref:Aspartoacylase n=1 Tax=Haloferax massiliensis TaxID=1476858 RepID=A0A0D6JLI4_9EURY|nr:succinylglutamate desuccinylase/aspartoacylase family protein [Haloferax massiliensis]CQR48772.1 aspartoacylase [Haloferax massiliensis]
MTPPRRSRRASSGPHRISATDSTRRWAPTRRTPPSSSTSTSCRTPRSTSSSTTSKTSSASTSGKPGPTAFVVGGVHGEEPQGYHAADQLRHLRPTGGKLVVVPRANRPAIEIGARYTEDGDLNRQFPTGSEPTSKLARALWDELQSHDPDVVVDLHSSSGIYRYDGKVGQAVFSTPATPENAGNACDYVNDCYIDRSAYPSHYDFDWSGSLSGSRPLFVHKAYGDLRLPGYIVETTRKGTTLEDAVTWGVAVARSLLWQHEVYHG